MASSKTRPLRHRDSDGLLVEQRRFFQSLADCGDPRRACEESQITWTRLKTWLARDRAFGEAWDRALGPSVDTVRELLETSATKAAAVLDEALDSDATIEHDAVCPACAFLFTVRVQIPNWQVRLRAGEMILKGARVLREVKDINVEGTVTHMTLEQRLALAAWKAGQHVTPQALTELRNLGLLKETPALPEGSTA